MSILNVVPRNLVTSAEDHHELAEQIDTALTVAAPAVATMPVTYGPAGTVFATAIVEFHATLTAAGVALVCQYERMSDALHTAAATYTSVDEASASAIGWLAGHDTSNGFTAASDR